MTEQPSYRFAGYTERWEEKKLGEIIDINSGESPAKFHEGYTPYVKVDDLNYCDKYLTTTKTYVDTNNKIKKIEKGSIVFPKRGAAILTNKIRILNTKAYMDTNMMSLSTDKSNLEFLYTVISNVGLYKIADTSTIPQINNKHILPYIVSLPSLPEQTAIGSFFQDIDQLISLQQRKLEVLKEQKKTYLKLLFPSKGQTKPALRFVGFEDEWKEVKLGDFVEISKGIQRNKEFLSPNADSKNCYPVYNGGKQESGYTDEFNREGNIMISEGGASAGFVNYFDGKYWSGGHNFTIDELENDIYYVLALLESQQQELYSLQVGSGLPNIQLNSLKKVIITFPAFLEQQAIGSFFQDLDKSIAKQEEKVNQLKESKQTLLRKMFI